MFKQLQNILSLIGMAFLIKYGYDFYQEKMIKKEIVKKEQTKIEQATRIAKKTSNAVMDVVSDSFITLGKITKKAQFKNMGTQTESAQTQTSAEKALEEFGNQVQAMAHALQRDDIVNEHNHNQLVARLKEVDSQIEHLEKYIKKGAPQNETLIGPAQGATQTIYERTIARKLLALSQKMELLFTDIINEMNGEELKNYTSETVAQGILHTKQLVKQITC